MVSRSDLLKMAAASCGYDWDTRVAQEREKERVAGLWVFGVSTLWDPIADSGQAFDLAVDLELEILHHANTVFVGLDNGHEGQEILVQESHRRDPQAATRLAIVKAAAALGMRFKEGVFARRPPLDDRANSLIHRHTRHLTNADITLYNRVRSKVDVKVRDIQALSYDVIYQIVREEIEIEREACAKICEERQLGIGCSHAFEAAQRIRERDKQWTMFGMMTASDACAVGTKTGLQDRNAAMM